MDTEDGQSLLFAMADTIREGSTWHNEVTVRDLLQWFGARRRGYWVVEQIREQLADVGLRTNPDFESAHIDAPIEFLLESSSPDARQREPNEGQAGNDQVVEVSSPSEVSARPSYGDPTYRLSKLLAPNKVPISVKPDAPLCEAVTLLLQHDFSQLPVMTSERDVKGTISWMSIGGRLALGRKGDYVREFMDASHQELPAKASLFQAIPIVVQHQYVLIRAEDKRIAGILTGSDLSLQFQQLAEPFLLLGEIENHIRKILSNRFTVEELSGGRDPTDVARTVSRAADLTFGEYIRLIENPDRWSQLELPVDRATFCKYLDEIRTIRNDVMHFDPDGIPPESLDRLRGFTRFLQNLESFGVS